MLDPWIIEEIKRREEERKRQPAVIELPLHGPPKDDSTGSNPEKPPKDEEDPRGVVIIDYSASSDMG